MQKTILCLATLLAMNTTHANSSKPEEPNTYFTVENAYDVSRSIVFFPYCLAAIVHEYGHALTHKIITGDPIKIVLGAHPEDFPPETIYKEGITIKSPDLTKGGFAIAGSADKNKDLIITAAGPIAGFIGLMGMNMIANTVTINTRNAGWFDVLIVWSKFEIYLNMIHNIRQLSPLCELPIADGQRIGKLLGMSDKSLQKFRSYSFIGKWLTPNLAALMTGYYVAKNR